MVAIFCIQLDPKNLFGALPASRKPLAPCPRNWDLYVGCTRPGLYRGASTWVHVFMVHVCVSVGCGTLKPSLFPESLRPSRRVGKKNDISVHLTGTVP